jgi:hypothetical protein
MLYKKTRHEDVKYKTSNIQGVAQEFPETV